MRSPVQVVLKNGFLKPSSITLNISDDLLLNSSSILLKISPDTSSSFSNLSSSRKYIFTITQLQQESDPLSFGDQYLFENFSKCKTGKYHLTCINYPKLQCQIDLTNNEVPILNQRKSNSLINLSGLECVEEKEQQSKEDFGKEQNQWLKSQQIVVENPLGTPKKAQISDFDRILSTESHNQQTIQNRYLRYFQQEFKIWRNFFQEKQSSLDSDEKIDQLLATPTKQKPKSEYRKNSDGIDNKNIEVWSKRQNNSPDLDFKFALSCGSPSNYENFSQFQKEKDKSVLSLLHSQDNYRNDEELEKQAKVMKKTNSEHRLNGQDPEKKDSEADTASKKKSKPLKRESFIEWVDSWAENYVPIIPKQRQDEHIVKQWLGYVQNKYKIAKFMHS